MRQNTDQTTNDSKTRLRHALGARRRNLSSHQRITLDAAIRRHLLQLVKSKNADSVACYSPFNGEPDITPLCRQLMADGLALALPVISGSDDHCMKFHPWRAGTTLAKNKYGIFEPEEPVSIPLSSFDMLFVPLLAYDRLGNRLGMGSGYYDRHLESLRDSNTPLRVGIAYSLQEMEAIDKNNWDIPLHGVVNEHGWFTFV